MFMLSFFLILSCSVENFKCTLPAVSLTFILKCAKIGSKYRLQIVIYRVVLDFSAIEEGVYLRL